MWDSEKVWLNLCSVLLLLCCRISQTLRSVAEARLGTEVLYELIEVRVGGDWVLVAAP